MRFKIDENLPVEVADELRNAGHDALTVQDQGLAGKPDGMVAGACLAEKRAILTLDLDFSDIRLYPPAEYAGIVVLRPSVQSMAAVRRLIHQIIALLATETLAGRLWIVDELQVRIRGDNS